MIGSLPWTDLVVVLRLMAVLALASWAARPLVTRVMPETGWIAATLVAWIVMGWVPWLLAALHLIPFAQGAFAGLVVLLLARAALPRNAGDAATPRVPGAVVVAGFFVLLFWLGLAQRLERADLSGLEKFTDQGFLAAAMRASFMPPQDAWYAGETINYYYVGQAMAAAWGHIAGARPDQAYQVAMATLFALSGLSVWAMTVALCQGVGRRAAQVLGGLAAVLVLYGGNFHSTLYTWFRAWMPATDAAYYFPHSTRYIGFDPPTEDKGFTEFLSYGFTVGDLHAHVAATPVFLLGVMVILSVLRLGAPTLAQAAVFGVALGLGAQTNSWDVAVLGMMALFTALALALRKGTPLAQRLDLLGQAAVVMVLAAFLTAAPFLGQFTPFANGIQPAPARTPLWQLLVLYGHFVLPLILLGVVLWKIPATRTDLRLPLLCASSVALIAVPEVMILRDIYGMDYARANTMFKLSFRAQTLMIIAGVAVLALAWAQGRRWRWAAAVTALPLVSILSYVPHVFAPPSVIDTLDGLGFLGDERALVARAATLPLAPGETMVEASGPAFGETARVSAMTGQPVVIGWAGHEWLWRNNGERPNARAQQVHQFYTTEDPGLRCSIVRRHGIRYAILGQVEQRHYQGLRADDIRALGVVIHDDAGGQIVQLNPDLCR